ncbi:tape measure domain-containing protein [Campylobacter ureolyticus ACS-301-V-Sch3b]|uniref:Tape measure domain-containing protein n=1 Tax=Campylobacter ureolyticus ACS-301-V-Sch3b TaxID=883165 RepID=S3XD87_9BACT|nr:tape measure protein [Campylobacter ureolyticus]EPH07357.1 tape measure domain-containing protein [Campylobacter ureolyticus ACS-301-V-Sch3b]EPH08168.1 tape measure domain-containing protein [Campylobacter ureolyticus ACS-301-V-Sch3b]
MKNLNIKISVDSANANSNVDKLSKSFKNLKDRVDFGAHLSQFAAGLSALSGSIAGMIDRSFELADSYKSLVARVNLVSSSNNEFIAGMREIYAISQSTASGFESTAGLYTSLKTATESLAISQRDLLGVTKTINQTLTISGASASASSAALIQLSQAFASGVLRGDELNSILEQSPRLARAIADGMGVTVGALRELGAQGKLTAEEVFNALQNQADTINDEFSKMPLTISNARVKISNSLLSLVGDLDSVSGASGGVADSLNQLSNWIDKNKSKIIEFGSDTFKSFQLIGSSLILVVNAVREAFLSAVTLVASGVKNLSDSINKTINSILEKVEIAINSFNNFIGVGEISLGRVDVGANINLDALKAELNKARSTTDEIFKSIKYQISDIAKDSAAEANKELEKIKVSDIKNKVNSSKTLIKAPLKGVKTKLIDPKKEYLDRLNHQIAYYDAIDDLENKRLKQREKRSFELKELGLNELQISKKLADEELKYKQDKDLEFLRFKERYYELLGDKVKASNYRLKGREIEMRRDGYSGLEISDALYGKDARDQNYENLNSSMGYDLGITNQFQNRLNALDEFQAMEAARIEAHYASLEQTQSNHRAKQLELDRLGMQYRMSIAGAGFDGLANLAKMFYDASGGKNKAALRAYQSMMVGKAIVNTYTAATNAYATAGNPYLGAALAAIAIAQGMAQVAMIKAQKFHTGGLVGGGLERDEVPAILQTGEYVLSRRDVANLKDNSKNESNDGVVIVNTLDSAVFEQWANSRNGKRVIKNVISGE